jgi:hypothetical protein
VQERPVGVDRAGMVAREQFERQQRGASAGRALVFEPSPEQLELLAKAELADRAEGDRALAIVGATRRRLELVGPRGTEARQLALGALLRELLRLRGCFLERQEAWSPFNDRGAGPTYRAEGRNRRPVRFCSRMCADQPATREQANIAGASGGGILAISSRTAE